MTGKLILSNPKEQAMAHPPASPLRAPGTPRVPRYTAALGARICELIALSNTSFGDILAADPTLPDPRLILRWLGRYPAFAANYALARQFQADRLADECIEIADNCGCDIVTESDPTSAANQALFNAALATAEREISARMRILARIVPQTRFAAPAQEA